MCMCINYPNDSNRSAPSATEAVCYALIIYLSKYSKQIDINNNYVRIIKITANTFIRPTITCLEHASLSFRAVPPTVQSCAEILATDCVANNNIHVWIDGRQLHDPIVVRCEQRPPNSGGCARTPDIVSVKRKTCLLGGKFKLNTFDGRRSFERVLQAHASPL